MGQGLLLVYRFGGIPVVNPMKGQVVAEVGVGPTHGGNKNLRTAAPAVVHGFHAVDFVFLALPDQVAAVVAGEVEMATVARAHAGSRMLVFLPLFGHWAVVGVVNIEW